MKTFQRELLLRKYEEYASADFIKDDPIQIPRRFNDRNDQEIIGFLAATIAWGQRVTIIRNAERMVEIMQHEPYSFIMHAKKKELDTCASFVHRTFNGDDLITFFKALKRLFKEFGSLENAFFEGEELSMGETISRFKQRFFQIRHPDRTRKHVADPLRGSSAKRINMFMRWMARPNDREVDLGIWDPAITPRLHVPLDVHTGNTARALGILKRKQNDWKAVVELTEKLREIDASDPVRFDIPLFAIGVYEPELITG